MIKNIKCFIILIFFFFYNSLSFGENKILFIDIDFIFSNSTAGKKISDKIQVEAKKINLEMTNYQKELKEDKDKIISQKNVLSQEELQKKSIDLKNQIDKYNKMLSDMNNQLNKNRNKAKVQFSKELSTIVQKYASDNSIEKAKKYNKIISTKNNKLSELKKNADVKFYQELTKIVQEYAQNNSVEMIVKKQNIIIGKTSLDATKDVLSLFDKKIKNLD